MNSRDRWAELGVAKKYLYHEQHVEDLDVDRAPMMMSGLLVDCQSRHWKLICSQMQKFPRAHIDPSQDVIKKIIDKHILFTDKPPHDKGQMWVVKYLQRIKAQLQNMAFGSRDDICARLRTAMHQLVTMLSELVTAGVAIQYL